MKTIQIPIIALAIVSLSIISCKKGEVAEDFAATESASSYNVNDSISSVASLNVENKKFVKTAQVNMEVKDVYKSTITIEKLANEVKGFVTHSNLQSNITSENTYALSDKEAIIIKKYQSENTLQVRIPTERLGEFLEKINHNTLFLNNRLINAEDITANVHYAELEAERTKKNAKNIASIKKNEKTIAQENENLAEENQQKLNSIITTDDLKYSTVDIVLKEPSLRTAEIPVANTENFDNQYKYNFWFDIKNAFVEGFYLIQRLITWAISIWPIILILGLGTYLWKKRKSSIKPTIHHLKDS